jgi:hypothetical protein
MQDFIIFILMFIFSYVVYYFLVLSRPEKLNKYMKSVEVLYLTNLYKLDISKLNFKIFARTLILMNSFIVSLVVQIIMITDNYLLMIVLGFALIILFILIGYHILGMYYKRKVVK